MPFTPSARIHPGQIIARTLEREGMSQKNLGERTGITEKHLSHIINGEASITVETALLLENALGGSASFWINLEKNFQEAKAREARASHLDAEIPLASLFPYAELAKRQFVENTRVAAHRVENLWKFFGVNSLRYVEATEAVAYRKRDTGDVKSEMIAAWLRCGEIESKDIEVDEFSSARLKKSVAYLRTMTTLPAEEFSMQARERLRESGVRLVYTPHFPGAGVSGAVRWVRGNPLVQISLLGKYADIFWFNLFHEIGHILLHGKKEKFIEFDNPELSVVKDKEQEANIFAGEVLIPREQYEQFVEGGDLSRMAVLAFARSIELDPGIVEGRLCHDGKLSWSHKLGFRTRLQFAK